MNSNRQAVIVAGVRTPFAKRQTAFKYFTPLDLGKLVCAELLERADLEPKTVDQVVFGQVIPSLQAPNVAREIVLGLGMPPGIPAYTVSKACITSYQTTVNVLEAIQEGAIECGIAGGTESASDVPMMASKPLQDALHDAASAKTLVQRLAPFRNLSPSDLLPRPPAIAEPSTGETMGEAGERMAKENGISREAQDEFAHRSHQRAAHAWREGKFSDEVMAVHIPPDFTETLVEDNLLRPESDLATYAKLKPVFDKKYGTVTAGNSSPLTDGASALLLMNEAKAKALGMPILGKVRSYAFAALDPFDQLLLGPAYATPIALERAGMTLADMDLIDMHEAFAATVLSTIQAFESATFAREKLNRSEPIGKVDWDKLNVNGGSIAMGHPFAATGAREIAQTLGELKRRGGGVALCTACAAGGMGAAMVLEVTS
ncbi:acetyl-CoA C-acyltransferase FadI [Nitrosococcus wardiae]|uniref:Acetyl-CoA C-acyltransferase FadI n=1 Tax=Nitrosococcus wardiae TaxID=1814290 RepID=A0A4P7C1Q5_9GAMM|nr:acetyl-CoA C-acyltransferase FadI [Nitrosococcus wardiae]QBQ55619.1 acetyl-CoA C-acyltransferase FadI [Nitrosococcus wardiae]